MGHTLGPLTIKGPSPLVLGGLTGGDYIVLGSDGHTIGQAYRVTGIESRENAEANARLWAAAPDLLAVLEELVDLVEDARQGKYKIDYFTTQPGRHAIAKAKGE